MLARMVLGAFDRRHRLKTDLLLVLWHSQLTCSAGRRPRKRMVEACLVDADV